VTSNEVPTFARRHVESIDRARRGPSDPRGREDLEVDRRPHPSPPITEPRWRNADAANIIATDRHRRNGGGVTDVMTARITVPNRREILRLFWRGARTGCRKRQSAMANRPA
jgi:hypothetical protein